MKRDVVKREQLWLFYLGLLNSGPTFVVGTEWPVSCGPSYREPSPEFMNCSSGPIRQCLAAAQGVIPPLTPCLRARIRHGSKRSMEPNKKRISKKLAGSSFRVAIMGAVPVQSTPSGWLKWRLACGHTPAVCERYSGHDSSRSSRSDRGCSRPPCWSCHPSPAARP